MIVDIYNEVFTKLKTTLTGVTVLNEYPSITPTFPCLIFADLLNDAFRDSIDSAGEQHNELSFRVEIYSNAQNKVTQVKTIRNNADAILSDFYGMTRGSARPIPNLVDNNIYRYEMTYTCVVDKNKKIFRR
jgi:hypothetical protein